MNIERLGQVAYTTYGEGVGNKTFKGNPWPDWSDLPEFVQEAWCQAAKAVIDSVAPVFSDNKEAGQ
ncbi:MAG: hypothetical protein KME29_05125 [Calothrix sp. FI2-JRJ7]|jgi:hypothetical protein|nr:hypothetical protein [Calothrix sp. FI2-JRJ7]